MIFKRRKHHEEEVKKIMKKTDEKFDNLNNEIDQLKKNLTNGITLKIYKAAGGKQYGS